MTDTGTTIWPNDVVLDPQELSRDSPHRLICFLLSPFDHLFDQVHAAVRLAADSCATMAGVEIECRRADTISESKVIHDDIWRHISAADFLVVDVTGHNANVMIEYGVAATLRRPHHVILIKAEDDPSPLPFNAFAQRCLRYRRSILGDQAFIQGLVESMIQAVTPAPYLPPAPRESGKDGFKIDLREGDRPALLLSPGITHRRIAEDGLEFGSFYVFRNSWLLLTTAEYRNVQVRVRFRFAEILMEPGRGWLGISLRNHHFFANFGHMAYVRTHGLVYRSVPEDERGKYDDKPIGQLKDFDHRNPEFIDLFTEFNDKHQVIRVGGVEAEIPLSSMPYVYAAGRVRVITSKCRVRIQEIELKPLP